MTGRLEVFVTSPWVPLEWIRAHGLEPRGAWFGGHGQATAVPEGVCAFAQNLADLARAHPNAATIFTTACDQMRRAADCVILSNSRVFLFNLPATWQSPAARRLYHTELARLGRFLETLGGRTPSQAELEQVIRDYEQRRARLRECIEQNPARQATEAWGQLLDTRAASPLGSPQGSTEQSPGFGVRRPPGALGTEAGQTRAPEGWRTPGRCRAPGNSLASSAAPVVPLALVGGPLLPSQWPLFDAIESAGGRVVLNATEPGERCLLPPFPNRAPDLNLFARLADHYFDHAVDVFHRPNSRLYAWLRPRLTERRVRGIVLWVHVGCDLWRAEAASLREAFGLPVLVLESHEAGAGGLRDKNRLAAFLESLQNSVQPFVAGATKGCRPHSGAAVPSSPR